MPKTGPKDGSLNATIAFLFLLFNACPSPIVTVDLPSPAGVGLIAVTNNSFPFLLSLFISDLFNTLYDDLPILLQNEV